MRIIIHCIAVLMALSLAACETVVLPPLPPLPGSPQAVSFSPSGKQLDILGLTTDMTVREMIDKIEPYNKSNGLPSSRGKSFSAHFWPGEGKTKKYYSYILSYNADKDDTVIADVESSNLDEKPFRIRRWIAYQPAGYATGDHHLSLLVNARKSLNEKLGKPHYDYLTFVTATRTHMAWLSNKQGNTPTCQLNKDYPSSLPGFGLLMQDSVGCDSLLQLEGHNITHLNSVKADKRHLQITLENRKRVVAILENITANRPKNQF